jgi:hypothetical protein
MNCRRRLKQLALLPLVASGSIGFAVLLVFLSYRAASAEPVHDSIHRE